MLDNPLLDDPVLDNPVWASLVGIHAAVAQRHGRAARYLEDVAPFATLEDLDDPAAWADLAELTGGATVVVAGAGRLPADWTVEVRVDGVQLIDTALEARPDPEARVLTTEDVPAMLDLVARTEPGPFRPRTIELGTYLGIFRDGALVAMAGERVRPAGWTEVSAVCTDPAYRGHGLATRLVRAVADGIRARGETPFLHTAAANTNAIRLYESIGFTWRRAFDFAVLRAS